MDATGDYVMRPYFYAMDSCCPVAESQAALPEAHAAVWPSRLGRFAASQSSLGGPYTRRRVAESRLGHLAASQSCLGGPAVPTTATTTTGQACANRMDCQRAAPRGRSR